METTTITLGGLEAVEQKTFAKGKRLREGEKCYLVEHPFRDGIVFQIYLEYALYPDDQDSTDQTGWNFVVETNDWMEYSRGKKPYRYSTIQECYGAVLNLIVAYMAGYNVGHRGENQQ